jgi:hypothetical protein
LSLVVATLVPGVATLAAAAAARPPSLVDQAAAIMGRQTATAETGTYAIPVKQGTKFTLACRELPAQVVCNEHESMQLCADGRPWILEYGESFLIRHNRIEPSLSTGLIATYVSCP